LGAPGKTPCPHRRVARIPLRRLPPAMRRQAEAKLKQQPHIKRLPRRAPKDPVGRLLWHIDVLRLPPPEREYEFHPTRRWRFDLAWPEKRIALEVEGVTAEGGRHQRIAGYGEDCRKYNAAQLEGWTVLRFTQVMVKRGEAIRALERIFG